MLTRATFLPFVVALAILGAVLISQATAKAIPAHSTKNYIVKTTTTPLPEVVATTTQLGWPHQVTEPEMIALVNWVHVKFAGPVTGAITCQWPDSMTGRGYCGVFIQELGKSIARFRVDFRIWEDGSVRAWRKRPVTK